MKSGLHQAANFGLRRLGWGKHYYTGSSAAGIRAALTGKAHFPTIRRTIGGIAPDLTGLSDYELSKGLTEAAKHHISKASKGKVSHEDIIHMLGGKTNLPKDRIELLDKLKQNKELKMHFSGLGVNPQSVLGKNLKGGIEKFKKEGLEPKRGAIGRFFRKYAKGQDKQKELFTEPIAQLSLGQIPTTSVISSGATHAANKGFTSPILAAKGHVMESGIR